MKLITLDFETYYDKTYSLSRLTTEEYIRDPRFEVILVSLKVDDEAPLWITGTDDEIGEVLRAAIDNDTAVLAHNAAFDCAILNWRYGVRPGLILDTLSMARAVVGESVNVGLAKLAEYYGLGAKGTEVERAIGRRRQDFSPASLQAYAEYCMQDTQLCYDLFQRMAPEFPEDEFHVVDMTIRMFTEPVLKLDTTLLGEYLDKVRQHREDLIATANTPLDVLRSDNRFAEMLLALGVDPPTKISMRTGKEAWAFAKTDKEFQELLDHEDIRVSALVAARLGNKTNIEESRAERFLAMSKRGRFAVPLRYSGTNTHRYSGSDRVNIQNLPSRDKNKRELKRSIMAPDGHVICAVDSSQIEARLNAYFCQQTGLVEAFAHGRDVYSEFASIAYGRTITKDSDPDARFVGKTCILGLGYYLGASKLQNTLRLGGVTVDDQEAERLVKTYRRTYDKIPAMWYHLTDVIDAMVHGRSMRVDQHGLIRMEKNALVGPTGLRLYYNDIQVRASGRDTSTVYYSNKKRAWQYIYSGKLLENIIQFLARCVIAEQMVAIKERYKVVFQVHDEIVFVAPEKEAEEAMQFALSIMSTPPVWAPDLPVACEGGYGYNYADAK